MVPSSDTFIVLVNEALTGAVGPHRWIPAIPCVNDADFQLRQEKQRPTYGDYLLPSTEAIL